MVIKIRNGLFVFLGTTALVSILLFSGTMLINEILHYKAEIKNTKTQSINNQKETLLNEIDKVFSLINYLKSNNPNLPLVDLQNEILAQIEKVRFGNGGYLFVNTFDGKALIFDGKRTVKDKSIINLIETNGNELFYKELEAAQNEDGGYIEYQFKKMNTDSIFPKIAYIKGYADWEWIVGAGVYNENLSPKLILLKTNLNTKIKTSIIQISVISILLVLIVIVFSLLFSNKAENQFRYLSDLLKDHLNPKSISNYNKFYFKEFIDVAQQADSVLAQKLDIIRNLTDTKEEYKRLVENSMVGIFITTDKRIEYCNQKFADYFDYPSPEYLIGKSIFDLVYHQDAEFVSNHINERNNNEFAKDEYNFRGKTKTNKTLYLEVKGSVIKYKEKLSFLGNLLDITQSELNNKRIEGYKNNLENLINERTKELELKNEILSEKNSELTKYNEILISRELEIKDLQKEIEIMETRLSRNI